MRPDDFGRLGELMRRGGVWHGKRLLSQGVRARTRSRRRGTNGCYGWLIWVNAGAPCVGPTITERPVEDGRDFPDLPADMYRFSGLFGQLVTRVPDAGHRASCAPARTRASCPAGGASWEHDLYAKLLGLDHRPEDRAAGRRRRRVQRRAARQGLRLPELAVASPTSTARAPSRTRCRPPGPRGRARPQLGLARRRASRTGGVAVRMSCPRLWPGREPQPCVGTARSSGARSAALRDRRPARPSSCAPAGPQGTRRASQRAVAQR